MVINECQWLGAADPLISVDVLDPRVPCEYLGALEQFLPFGLCCLNFAQTPFQAPFRRGFNHIGRFKRFSSRRNLAGGCCHDH